MSSAATRMHETVNPSREILNSWKEIARYLDRGVRTVQRWEAELGLPVRRPNGRGRSAVFCLRSELDAWVHSCPRERLEETSAQSTWPSNKAAPELLIQARQLRADVSNSRHEMENALTRLVETLGRIIPPPRDRSRPA